MRKAKYKRAFALFQVMAMLLCMALQPCSAYALSSDRIVVSLGDSYSSGEGNPSFYGQDFATISADGVTEGNDAWIELEDFYAHRSTKSWPGQLVLDGVTLSSSRYHDVGADAKWYFYASSGAVAYNIYGDEALDERGEKRNPTWGRQEKVGLDGGVRVQLDAAKQDLVAGNHLKDVSYVTMTIGGNDMNFAEIVEQVAIRNGYVDRDYLRNAINNAWYDYDESVRYNTVASLALPLRHLKKPELKHNQIRTCYEKVRETFGPDAIIIVAGYPTLMNDEKWKKSLTTVDPLESVWRLFGASVSENVGFADWEAGIINENVRDFNDCLESIIEGMEDENTHFVSVLEGDHSFEGHEAYTGKKSYIYGIKFYDSNGSGFDLSYSFHPNKQGLEAYRAIVQAKIDELEPLVAHHGSEDGSLVNEEQGDDVSGETQDDTYILSGRVHVHEEDFGGQRTDSVVSLVLDEDMPYEYEYKGTVQAVAHDVLLATTGSEAFGADRYDEWAQYDGQHIVVGCDGLQGAYHDASYWKVDTIATGKIRLLSSGSQPISDTSDSEDEYTIHLTGANLVLPEALRGKVDLTVTNNGFEDQVEYAGCGWFFAWNTDTTWVDEWRASGEPSDYADVSSETLPDGTQLIFGYGNDLICQVEIIDPEGNRGILVTSGFEKDFCVYALGMNEDQVTACRELQDAVTGGSADDSSVDNAFAFLRECAKGLTFTDG